MINYKSVRGDYLHSVWKCIKKISLHCMLLYWGIKESCYWTKKVYISCKNKKFLLLFHFWFLGHLFFYMHLVKGLLILFIFSKNQLLVSLIFCIAFWDSISFISALIFILFFLLLSLGFVCFSFSSSFKWT